MRIQNAINDVASNILLSLRDGFNLSASGTYSIQPMGSHATYLDCIAALPILPLPEAFGLHDNADITKDLNQTQLLAAGAYTRPPFGSTSVHFSAQPEPDLSF
jgi:hypothetical protein